MVYLQLCDGESCFRGVVWWFGGSRGDYLDIWQLKLDL